MSNGTVTDCSAGAKGGAVYNVSTFNLQGGTLNGGSAPEGGNIFHADGTVNITGGTITSGTATSCGGNICAYDTISIVDSSTDVKIQNGTVTGGNGGNLYFFPASTENQINLTRAGSEITGGTATVASGTVGSVGLGGSIYVGGELDLISGAVSGGNASYGGGVYVAPNGTFGMTGANASISECTATNQGGAGFIAGTFNMSAGTITADADSAGARLLRVQNGTANLSGTANLITNSTSANHGVDVVATEGNDALVTLAGGATFENLGNVDVSIYVQTAGAKLEVLPGWSGTAVVRYAHMVGEGKPVPYGQFIDEDYGVATGNFSGNLYMSGWANAPIGAKGGKLRVSGVSIQTEEGNSWYIDNEAAVDAYREGVASVIKLYWNDELDLNSKTVYVDFNGQQGVNVSNGTLCGIDTATDFSGESEPATVVFGDGVTVETLVANPLSDISYVALDNHFYPIRVNQAGMTMNPANTGLYFNATVECHPALTITKYGIDFALVGHGRDGVYNVGAPEDGKFYGYVYGIMGAGIKVDDKPVSDDETARTSIQADLYVTLNVGGQEVKVYCDQYEISFWEFMVHINDNKWEELTSAQKNTILKMYDKYEETMSTWNLQNIIEDYNPWKESQEG